MRPFNDLLILDDDLALNPVGLPEHVDGLGSVAQDIKHLIRETGLLVELVGERNSNTMALAMNRLTIQIEQDRRIEPGTVAIERQNHNQWLIRALITGIGDLEILV